MRFVLNLTTPTILQPLTLNYQYPLSAAIYKIIQRADAEYASFLHNTGYSVNNKTFKFFTFSDIRTPFYIQGDRLVMKTNKAELTVCFHIPDAAENFIKGLFMHQQLEIADRRSKAVFQVQQVVAENTVVDTINNKEVLLQPMSPVVVGYKNNRGHYDYLSPADAGYTQLLQDNLLQKYAAAYNAGTETLEQLKEQVTLTPLFFSQPPRQRLITIKEGSEAETKVKGYDKFRIKITAPAEVVNLTLNTGIGIYNAMGMGSVGVVRNSMDSTYDGMILKN